MAHLVRIMYELYKINKEEKKMIDIISSLRANQTENEINYDPKSVSESIKDVETTTNAIDGVAKYISIRIDLIKPSPAAVDESEIQSRPEAITVTCSSVNTKLDNRDIRICKIYQPPNRVALT